MGGELSKNMLLDFYKDITYSTLHTALHIYLDCNTLYILAIIYVYVRCM